MSPFRVHIQPSTLALDIGDYISYNVGSLLESGDLVTQDPALKEIIIEKLVRGAQGMYVISSEKYCKCCSLIVNRFLWVKFQLDDLCDAESDAEIKRVLNNLPKDLSETYARLLGRITGSQRQELAKKMFQWIICARRPLHVEELREGIAFTINDQFFDRDKLPTDMPRLIRGCGNLVVIDEETQQVHLAHYTVQQYILLEEGISFDDPSQTYHFAYNEANNIIGETCIAYLSFSDFETQVSKTVNKNIVEMALLQRATASGIIANTGRLGTTMRQALALVHKTNASVNRDSLEFNYRHLLPRRGPPSKILFESYRLLTYIVDNWLFHTIAFEIASTSMKRDQMLKALIVDKNLPFIFRPWELSATAGNINYLCLYGWALENDHVPALRELSGTPLDKEFFARACNAERLHEIDGLQIRKERMAVLNSLAQLRTIAGADDSEQLAWLYSKLILACRQGNLRVLRYCFDSQDMSLGLLSAIGHILCEAAAYGHQRIVEWVARGHFWGTAGAPWLANCNYLIDGYDTIYFNPMEIAILRGYPRIAITIQENTTEKIDTRNLFQILLGQMGDVLKNCAVVDAILQVITPEENKIVRLLHYHSLSQAARSDDITRITRYAHSFELEEPVKSGLTPLWYAIAEGNPALIRALVEFGANTQTLLPSTESVDREVLINLLVHVAIADTATFDTILEVVNPITADQRDMLHELLYKTLSQAARSGDEARVERYLHTFDLERPLLNSLDFSRNLFGSRKLSQRLNSLDLPRPLLNSLDLCRPLLNSLDFDLPIQLDLTPLSSAVLENNVALVTSLVKAGASINSLLKLLERHFEEVARNAADLDAILGILNPETEREAKLLNGMKLFRALKKDDKPRINELIRSLRIADPQVFSLSSLISAVLEREPELALIIALLDAGDYINETGSLEAAAWHAIRVNNLKCLRVLTEMGADLTTPDENSLSTLDYAVQNKRQNIFFFLLQTSGTGPKKIPISRGSLSSVTWLWEIPQQYWQKFMQRKGWSVTADYARQPLFPLDVPYYPQPLQDPSDAPSSSYFGRKEDGVNPENRDLFEEKGLKRSRKSILFTL
jgi:ankyrin repeat protein